MAEFILYPVIKLGCHIKKLDGYTTRGRMYTWLAKSTHIAVMLRSSVLNVQHVLIEWLGDGLKKNVEFQIWFRVTIVTGRADRDLPATFMMNCVRKGGTVKC